LTTILITGAAGAVGQALLRELGENRLGTGVIATDIRPPADLAGAQYVPMDVCGPDAEAVIGRYRPDIVVHLASIVTPPPGATRSFQYQVDVEGTRNVLQACVRHRVGRLVVTSSGAAYGYHADNPVPLSEDDPLRGNEAFAYSHHKRLVEEMLAEARRDQPDLEQVVLRVGTVLGAGLENQITALFRRDRLIGVSGSESPFVFIWVRDLARILVRATGDGPAGIYNVCGDGAMGTSELARVLGKPVLWLPAWLLRGVLALARPLRLSRYGPEQVRFLQYRPVLDNTRLKSVFGYTPEKTSAEAFEAWRNGAMP
jgi:UDP-glucose 4-epimerase